MKHLLKHTCRMFVSDGHGRADNEIHRILSINLVNYWIELVVCLLWITMKKGREGQKHTEERRKCMENNLVMLDKCMAPYIKELYKLT